MTCFRLLGLDEMFYVLEDLLSLHRDSWEEPALSKSVFGQVTPLTFLILAVFMLHRVELQQGEGKSVDSSLHPPLLAYLGPRSVSE